MLQGRKRAKKKDPASVETCCTLLLGKWARFRLVDAVSRSTKETKKAETALAELRGRAEAEKEGLRSAAAAAEDRVAAVREQMARLEQELQSYKVGVTF